MTRRIATLSAFALLMLCLGLAADARAWGGFGGFHAGGYYRGGYDFGGYGDIAPRYDAYRHYPGYYNPFLSNDVYGAAARASYDGAYDPYVYPYYNPYANPYRYRYPYPY